MSNEKHLSQILQNRRFIWILLSIIAIYYLHIRPIIFKIHHKLDLDRIIFSINKYSAISNWVARKSAEYYGAQEIFKKLGAQLTENQRLKDLRVTNSTTR